MIEVHLAICNCGKCHWMFKLERGKVLRFRGFRLDPKEAEERLARARPSVRRKVGGKPGRRRTKGR